MFVFSQKHFNRFRRLFLFFAIELRFGAFFRDGIDCGAKSALSHSERLAEGEKRIIELLKITYSDRERFDNAYDALMTAMIAYEAVYMEIGIQIGAQMMMTLQKNNCE